MQLHNNILSVEANWLIESGVMTEVTYKHLRSRRQINVVRRGCKNTPALVAYESMPERFKRDIRDIVGDDLYKAVLKNEIEEKIEDSLEATEFFETYQLSDGRYLPKETRREYYANTIVLDAIHRLITETRSSRSSLGRKTVRNWEKISEHVQDIDRSKYPHALPANPRRLEERYKKYQSEGYLSLVHKNFKNKNAIKVEEGANENMMLMLISDPRNLDNEQAAKLYNMMAKNMGWQKIGRSTVAVWRDKYDSVIAARRHGSTAFRNTKTMQVKRSAPSFPLLYWTMDGWDVELMYQKTENGRTTYHHRPTVVVVLDACLKYPVGYAIGTHETPELIQEALRNAAKHTESLFGQMYRTNQLQSDHYAIKKMTPTYEGMAEMVTPAKVKNAKAKIIEPYFRYINKKHCQLQKNWSGFGVTSKKGNQPNVEFLNKYRHDFPDFEGVCKQVIELIESERAEKRAQYIELFGQLPQENRLPLGYEQYLLLFGAITGHKNLLTGSGLKVAIGGIKHDYDCFDLNFRKYASTRWEVRFDPDDTTKVLAVNEDESLRFLLEEKYVQPMALKERKEGDWEQLQRVKAFNEHYEEHVGQRLMEAHEGVQNLIGGNPQLEAQTLAKLLLVDSNGQHKDRRNDGRNIKAKAIPTTFEEMGGSDDSDDLYDQY